MSDLISLDALLAWIGRSETRTDTIGPHAARHLAETLDRNEGTVLGDTLPPLWHWIYFTSGTSQSALGSDGHPRLGGFMPPIPLPRRMWAGGRLDFIDPLRIGDSVERKTEITNIEQKQGRFGPLIFVTLRHLLKTERGLAIREEQDLVYRGAERHAPSTARVPHQHRTAEWRDSVMPDTRLLFRYSALTFNAHRIHYDLPYAREEEGYPALVVHGPLTTTLLVDRLIAHRGGRVARLAFSARSPLFCGTAFDLCGAEGAKPGQFDLWTEGPDAAHTMTATALLDQDDMTRD